MDYPPLQGCRQENCKGATRAALWPQPGLIWGCGNKHRGEMGRGCSALNNCSAWHGNGITTPGFPQKIHHLLRACVLGDKITHSPLTATWSLLACISQADF